MQVTGYRLQVIHLADAFIQSDLQVVQTIETNLVIRLLIIFSVIQDHSFHFLTNIICISHNMSVICCQVHVHSGG